jgi:quinol monooxygenase YgiN
LEPSLIHVIAVITALPERRQHLLGEIHAVRPAVLAEEGCLEFSVACDAPDSAAAWVPYGPDAVVIIEKWRDRAALRAHATSAHMAVYASRAQPLIASRAVHVLAPHDAP